MNREHAGRGWLLLLVTVLLGALGAGAVVGCAPLQRALAVPAHFTSHQLCSAVFAGEQDPARYFAEAIAPQIAPSDALVRYTVDPDGRSVRASFAGMIESRAVHRGAAGCLVLRDEDPAVPPIEAPVPVAPFLPAIAGPAVVEPADPRLRAALDRAFAETEAEPHRRTKAVVVVHRGRVVAERYAPGFTIDTPMPGWSMTKSVVNALAGILVRQGRLDMTGPAAVAAWRDSGDPRAAITADHLLRMTSGLDLGQTVAPDWRAAFDPSVQMAYDRADTAGFAASVDLLQAPGTAWRYADGSTQILSGILRDAIGGGPSAVLAFAHHELFDRLDMERVTLEFDAAGTPLGYAQMWASARDWARFGLLYAGDGVVGGERLLPEGWVAYSTRQTPGSEDFGYGAGFWTNQGEGPAIRYRRDAGMPAGSFMARGNQGQYVIVEPDAGIVIVRLGAAFTPRGDIETVARLARDVTEALVDIPSE